MNHDEAQEVPSEAAVSETQPIETAGKPVTLLAVATLPNKAQVTKAELDGILFYVRENAGNNVLWLNLCAPEQHWARIAAVVGCEDSLKREVLLDQSFTPEWAEQALRDAPKE